MRVIKHPLNLLFLFGLLVSCIGVQDAVEPTDRLPPTPVRGVLATTLPDLDTPIPPKAMVTKESMPVTAVPAVTAAIPIPTATRSDAAAHLPGSTFSGLRFSLTPAGIGQTEFPAGTEEVYAQWEYARMAHSDTIRRIWFRDDQIWLTREEGWNWGEYGSDGIMRDLSVYDNEGTGLPPATYRLQLYINNDLQQEAVFVISEP